MSNLPLELTITILVKDEAQASSIVSALIDWERSLRGPGVSGYIPVTGLVKLADSIRDARRTLQRKAQLTHPT